MSELLSMHPLVCRKVEILLRVHHKNLTALIGYCNEAENMALIYEFMANGTLGDYLSGQFLFYLLLGTSLFADVGRGNTTHLLVTLLNKGKKSYVLSWEERLQISLDAAQGLNNIKNSYQNKKSENKMK